jgi:hypothetical protein
MHNEYYTVSTELSLKSCIFQQSLFVGFAWFSQHIGIIFPNNFSRFVFLMEKNLVYGEGGAESSNTVRLNCAHQQVT